MRTSAFTNADDILRALEKARAAAGMSKAELARRSKIRAETVRRLLTATSSNPTLSYVLDLLRPMGLGLGVVPFPGSKPAVRPATPRKPGR